MYIVHLFNSQKTKSVVYQQEQFLINNHFRPVYAVSFSIACVFVCVALARDTLITEICTELLKTECQCLLILCIWRKHIGTVCM